MESSSGVKLEAIMRNPWLVKAGIPLLLSTTALITAKILKKRASSPVSPVLVKEEDDEGDHSSSISQAIEIETNLSAKLEDLKRREYELEKRFFIYQDLKERESMAMEIRNKLFLETNQLEFLAKEASLMEAEAQRLEELMAEYNRVLKKLENSRMERSLVEKKARKLRRRVMEKSKVVRKQSLCIEARDEEMIRNHRELERKNEEENIELLNKLEMVERSASTKPMIDEDFVTKEAYDKVMEELEKTVKDQAAMENELIHLRLSNACLKHELKSCQEQLESVQEDTEKKSHLELKSSTKEVVTLQQLFHEVECDGSPLVHDNEGSCLTQDGRFSKRKRFVKKLKKWVEGGKINEKQKNEEMNKCIRRNSVAHSEDAYESFAHPRDSFSSV
ncbi:hypothetical protein V2J09_009687 [Rumex salicifolius]